MAQSLRQRNLFAAEDIRELWKKKRISKSLVKNCAYYNNDWHPRQILWHEYHDQEQIPICQNETCTNNAKWNPDREQDLIVGQYNTYCSAKCAGSSDKSIKKRSKTCIEKYGVVSYTQTTEFQKKKTKTMREKYGVTHALQNKTILKQMNETMRTKYGTDWAMQNLDLKEKARQTNLKRYGVENPMQNKEIQSKLIQHNYDCYGVPWYVCSDKFNLKSKNTCKDRYGSDRLMSTDYFWKSRNKTMVQKYGTIHALQNNQIKRKAFDTTRKRGKILESKFEHDIKLFLESLDIEYFQHDRGVLDGMEIDFYIPAYSIGIECNGVYWHSDRFKTKDYHYNKWETATYNGIHLIQINEIEWLHSRQKVTNLLISCINKKIKGDSARKCQTVPLSASISKKFIEKYHLQGFVAGTSHWGAYDSNEQLVGVMTFGWTRGSKKSRRFELKRWVTDDHSHAGLFSKVFKHAKQELRFDSVVSFSMNDWFTGNVYKKCGFEKKSILPPSYWYYYNDKRTHCSNFTKANIKKKLPNIFNESLTEREMMNNAGILKLWDAGKTEWIWSK